MSNKSAAEEPKNKKQKTTTNRLLVYVDLDNCVADLSKGVKDNLFINNDKDTLSKITEWEKKNESEYPAEVNIVIRKVMLTPHFFYNLDPYPGAVQAIQDMEKSGKYTVIFLTSPIHQRDGEHNCAKDKTGWVIKHFGIAWENKIIVAKYKDLFVGDILIDDLPQPNTFLNREPELAKGSPALRRINKAWIQVLKDQPYNRHLDMPRIADWKDWALTLTQVYRRLSDNEEKEESMITVKMDIVRIQNMHGKWETIERYYLPHPSNIKDPLVLRIGLDPLPFTEFGTGRAPWRVDTYYCKEIDVSQVWLRTVYAAYADHCNTSLLNAVMDTKPKYELSQDEQERLSSPLHFIQEPPL